jgi:O-antigen/teichoic acid export membrane protein
MDNLNKVSFPTFSRLQHDKIYLAKAVEKTIFFLLLLTIPAVFTSMILIDSLVEIIPKYLKWKPALFSFYLFSFSALFASVSSLLTNMIQAVGKVKITLKLMILWTTLTWIFIPILIKTFDFNGVAIAMLIISLTSIVTVIIAKKLVPFNIVSSMGSPIIIGLLTGLAMLLSRLLYKTADIYQIIIILLAGLITYLISISLFARKEVVFLIRQFKSVQRKISEG